MSDTAQCSSPMGESLGGLTSAPKKWKDLTADEKIERMRQIVKGLVNQIEEYPQKVDQLKADFQNHDHLSGKVVKDIKTNNILGGRLYPSKANWKDEQEGNVYF